MIRGFAIALLLSLAACGERPPLPPAVAQQASAETLEAIPGFAVGPYKALIMDPLILERTDGDLPLRVLLPTGSRKPPLIIFSHGNFSDRHKYDAVLLHWVSHGFAVVAPTHIDGKSMARGIYNSIRFGQMGLIEKRIADINWILGHLDSLEQSLGGLLHFDTERIVLAGHSFGAFTAQQFAGASAFGEDGAVTARSDSIKAVIALSPPGPMFEVIRADSWRQMDRPVLMTTGTWDVEPRFFPQWELHRMSFDTAVPGDQFALVVDGADHYLGNLICRPERDVAPQRDALAMVNALTTAFLQTYVDNNAESRQWLRSADLSQLTGGFADLQQR